MKNKRDLNDIAKIEKAIKDKYGKEAIQNPKKDWTKEKEEKYLQDLKNFYSIKNKNKIEKKSNGFYLKEREKRKTIERGCPVCGSYSFSAQDDLYMIKYECCFNCYIQHVEGREDRWNSGWRPNN
jgi:hypothetical protein